MGRRQFEKTCRAHLRKNCDQINAFQCGNDLCAITFAGNRATGSFQFADRLVAVDSDDQHVAQGASRTQVANVSDVEQIETSVRRYDSFPSCAQFVSPRLEFFQSHDFVARHFLTKFSARGTIRNSAGARPTSSPSTLNHIPGREHTAIFRARRKITALLEKCFPRIISAASNAISAGLRFGIKMTSSKPSLGSASGAIGNPPATNRPFAITILYTAVESSSRPSRTIRVLYACNFGNAAAAPRIYASGPQFRLIAGVILLRTIPLNPPADTFIK